MARLDRLGPAKQVAQLGATIGRTFAYALLQAVSPFGDVTLQQGLRQLVEAELMYQRGSPPRATYTFKHALIQDAAYHSCYGVRASSITSALRRPWRRSSPKRWPRSPGWWPTTIPRPGLLVQAVPHWQRAGEHAIQRSAPQEAITHLTTGLQLLPALPETRSAPGGS